MTLEEKSKEELIEMIKRLRLALDASHQWIYPKSFNGKYEKRTEFMEGWNAAALDSAKEVREILKEGDWE